MAPDLNSVPPSPHRRDRNILVIAQPVSPSLSRRTSAAMAPPPAPQNPGSPTPLRTADIVGDNIGVGFGPGPLRHPRPLTASEIYLECEKEQEGIVNRLTRELSQLRQQTASVASTTSSTSELLSDYAAIVPTSQRRHRSSSNLSTRSTRSINAATANATSISGVAPAREASVPNSSRPSLDIVRPDISRQNSAAGHRSVTASPSLASNQLVHNPPFPQNHAQSNRHSSASAAQSVAPSPAVDSFAHHARSPSFSAAVAAARYEEAAYHRSELEAVKRENEALRQRIRDLERSLGGNASRSRATSSIEQ